MNPSAADARVISGLQPPDDAAPAAPADDRAGARLPVLELDPRTYSRALDCVHCGLCLPACPTYTENGLEGDSPRGRIYLMKGLADGKVEPTPSVLEHLDLCLDCRACETACPSGVVYHELIEETRARLAGRREQTATLTDRLVERIFLHVFTRPTRLKLALLPARVLQKLGLWRPLTRSRLARLLPAQLRKMQQMLPPRGPLWERRLPRFYPARGERKATVGLFAGCVGSVLFQDVNRQTAELLQLAGCDVVVARGQTCCGAIHHHSGHVEEAKAFAEANIVAFRLGMRRLAPDVDFIVSNIAGCGAMLKDYAHLFGERDEGGGEFAARVRDVSELLAELQLPPPPREVPTTAVYHDACHLAHAQKVTQPPRALLRSVPGLKLLPLAESDMCCGAAGTYNLTQPEMARQLAERKLRHIRASGAAVCVTGNAGCAMQIQSEADRLDIPLRVVHPVTLLHEAHFGP